jgi:hypothetical protein
MNCKRKKSDFRKFRIGKDWLNYDERDSYRLEKIGSRINSYCCERRNCAE